MANVSFMTLRIQAGSFSRHTQFGVYWRANFQGVDNVQTLYCNLYSLAFVMTKIINDSEIIVWKAEAAPSCS